MKIGRLFEEFATQPDVLDDIIKTKKKLFIKGENGELVELEGVIKKSKCEIYFLEFLGKITLRCADKHLLKVGDNKFEYVKNLKIGKNVQSVHGPVRLLKKEVVGFEYVYDISMKKEYVYTTPNGLIHHNSMLAIQTIGAGQRKFDHFLATFMDSEEATTTQRLSNLGVHNPKIKPYTDITVEKVFKHLETMCLFKEQKKLKDKPSICVWDSIANTLSEKERQVDDINSVIGYKARLLSILVPKFVARCAQYNICWLSVNQLRDVLNISQFAAPKDMRFLSTGKSMPGGNILKFNAFTLVEMKAKSALDSTKMGFDGIIATVKTVKSKLFPPNIQIEIVGDFIRGFSNFWTNYNFLVKEKRLQSGSWNLLQSYPEKKFRTKDAENLYNTDEKFKKEFDKAVGECIQTEIIDKYNPEL
jgi:RecA/RadA recombinase